MNDKKKLLYAVGLLLVVGILAALVVNTTSNQETQSDKKTAPWLTPTPTIAPQKPVKLEYSAKFVCGNSSGGLKEPVLKGNYATAINVHNPQGTTVNLTKKAVIALREGEKWGSISDKINFAIGPDQAFYIDCLDIAQILKNSNIPMPTPFADGFVVIDTAPSDELDVVGVYTAGGENVESIDVVTVNPKTANLSVPPLCTKTSINLNTGFNQIAGTTISLNGTDDDWMVTADPFNGTTEPRLANVVANNTPGNGIWPTPYPNSNWISFDPSRGEIMNSDGKNFTYRYSFTLPQCFSNANLSLNIRADNVGWVFLNGYFVGGPINYPSTLFVTTSNQAYFMPGQNNVMVVVHNNELITGFNLNGTVTAN
ncbi:MAG: hypothetical protein WCE94_09080 [Candidatus Methanoperedens sp.]